jgi:mutual gliding-motility protein MglA
MRINAAANEIILKIVYYGPGMAGKTTNLTVIHDRMPSHAAGDLVMVDTHSERTLRFDLLAVDGGGINGHHIHYEFYTVPGQSYYAATRRAVLAGADAVVFVADSRREALDENIEAMNEMLGNLRHHGLPDDIPMVIQYNKQDLPTSLKREQLEPLMNVRGWPSVAAVAVDGNGVMETMQLITQLATQRVQNNNLPAATAVETPSSWLISCYRCQSMLEVPDAQIGSIYACGICGSALEVIDADRGLTRAPAPSSVTAVGTAGSGGHRHVGSGGHRTTPLGNQRAPSSGGHRSVGEDSVYGMQAIPDGGSPMGVSAIAPDTGNLSILSTPFEIPGYDVMGIMDESVQGRRMRVRERSTGRTLRALILSPSLMRQPSYAENLEPHIRLAGQVKHPYILPLVAMTPAKESMVLFSADPPDYEPLGHILARRRALAPPHAMGILRQIVLALEESARHGVVHGWLRPEVILVSADGNVVVDEFGVPKNHRYLVRELSGASAATEYYLAPEHLSGDTRSDARSDIFVLGALLFRMMTGEGLVTGYNAHEALHKVVANGARTLRSIQPSVSRDLDLFCQHMVNAERKDRIQSYREVLDQLDKFGGGAKRQTLRLTQGVSANPASAQIRRSGTGQLRRPGTGQIPRGLAAQGTQRRTPGSGENLIARPRQPASSNTGVGVMVVVMVVVVAVVAYLLFGQQPGKRASAPVAPESQLTQPAAKPSTTSSVAKPASTDAVKDSNPTTPSWMAKNDPAKNKPAAVTPTQVNQTPVIPAAPLEPAAISAPSTPIPSAPVMKPEDRISVVLAIAELERAGRYKEAMAKCEMLPSAEERQARIAQVANNHAAKRQDIAGEVAMAKDADQAQVLLKPAQQTWGLPGDKEWADELLAAAKKRLGAKPGATIAGDKPVKELPKQVPVDNAIAADAQVNKALANGQMALANQGYTSLNASSPAAIAIKRKLELFNSRSEILARILEERHPKLRVLHPTTNEQWDVVSVTENGMTVSSAAGSKTDLTWNQVVITDIARIFFEAAAHPNTKPEEHALAAVMQMVAGDATMASLVLKRGKGVIEPAVGADLELLINLLRQSEVLELASIGKAAAASGNAKTLNDTIEQMKKLDPKLLALVADDLAHLEAAKNAPAMPGTVAGTGVGKDRMTFDSNEELKTFAERSGTWVVANGMVGNSTVPAKLMRKDLDDVRAAVLRFMPMSNKGQMSVDFRGVRFVIDFATSNYQAISREETTQARKFSFLPKAVCSLFFELRQPGNIVQITINNAADSVSIKAGEISSLMSVQCENANIAIDELQILRGRPVANKDEQNELKKLGLNPLGNAVLEAPTIILPTSRGESSGVAMAIRENIAGATFEVKGEGMLRLQLGSPTDRSGQWIDVPIGAVPVAYQVTWLPEKMLIKDAAGNEVGNVKLIGKHTHFMIIALKDATLLTTPRLNYQ